MAVEVMAAVAVAVAQVIMLLVIMEQEVYLLAVIPVPGEQVVLEILTMEKVGMEENVFKIMKIMLTPEAMPLLMEEEVAEPEKDQAPAHQPREETVHKVM